MANFQSNLFTPPAPWDSEALSHRGGKRVFRLSNSPSICVSKHRPWYTP